MNGDLQPFLIKVFLRSLQNGEVTKQTLQVFAYAANYLRKGEPIPEPLAGYLATAFDKIAQGKPAKDALSLNRKRGRKESVDGLELAKQADDLIEGGASPWAAFATVAGRYAQGLDPKNVKRAYDIWKDGLEAIRSTDLDG